MSKRGRNTFINILVIVVMQIANLFYALISKRLFLDQFSISVYGVIDLFGSFFRSLMMLELGFGSILVFNLYKPVSNNNINEIRRQLSLFKTVYAIISFVILCISLLTLPFIYKIFNISCKEKLLVYTVYLLNVFSILIKYHYLNKISILNAGQVNYVQNITIIITDFICFIIKVLSLVLFHNAYLYVTSLLLIPSLAYILQSIWVDNYYDIKKIEYAKISDIKDSEILTQMSKYIYATIYNLIFLSMDNMIISVKISTDAVAYMSNYLSIINIGSTFVETISLSLRGIIADYRFSNNDSKEFFRIFKYLSIIFFFMTSIIIVGFYSMIDDFISLWIGQQFVIKNCILIILLLIQLMDCLFEPISIVFNVSGYMFVEKYPLILSAITNLILTIVFIDCFGLIGAYIATLIATIIKWISKFYYVLSGVLKKFSIKTISIYFLYLSLNLFEMLFVKRFVDEIILNVNSLILFIYKTVLVIIVTSIISSLVIFLDTEVLTNIRRFLKSL